MINIKDALTVDIIKNEYCFLKVTPSDVVTNLEKELELFIKTLSSMHRGFWERSILKPFGKKEIQKPYHFTYEILISKTDIEFYFRVPEDYRQSIMAKMNLLWAKCPVINADDPLQGVNLRASSYKRLYLKDYSFKSLMTNLTTHEPLPSIFGIQTELNPDEKVMIQFIFSPLGDSWNTEAREQYDDYKNGKLPKKQNKADKIWSVADYVMNDFQYIFDSIIGGKSNEPIGKKNLGFKHDVTNKEKMNLKGFKTDIKIIAQARETKRRDMLIHGVAVGFDVMTKDNSLTEDLKSKPVYVKLNDKDSNKKRKVRKANEALYDIRKRRINNDSVLSEREVMQIMRMPERSIQEKLNIERSEANEFDIPDIYTKGAIRLAKLYKKGKSTYITLPDNFNSACKPLIIIGPSGGGKSTTSQNMLLDICNNTKDGLVVYDYIKDCELTKYIVNRMDDDSNVVLVDMTDIKHLPNINICELDISNMTQDEREKSANTIYLIYKKLIEQLKSEGTEEMTVRMLKYLGSACAVVFVHANKSICDVKDVLENYTIRQQYINEALKLTEIYDNNSEDIKNLRELDKGNGTDTSKIAGILDRITMFVNCYHMKKMIKSKIDLNFIDLMEQGKRVFFMMPDSEFIDKTEVDIIVSCFLAKMWTAWKKRGGKIDLPKIFHVFVDECHQVPSVCKALSEFMVEVRKYGGAFKFTCHDMKQMKILKEAVQATGANYMIVFGTEENITKEIGVNVIKPYTPEEINKFPEWTALLILKENNVASIIKANMMDKHHYNVKKRL